MARKKESAPEPEVFENFGDLWRAQEKLYKLSGWQLFFPIPEAAIKYAVCAFAVFVFGTGLPVVGPLLGLPPLLAQIGIAVVIGFLGAVARPDGRALHLWALDRVRLFWLGSHLVRYQRPLVRASMCYGDIPVISDGRTARFTPGTLRAKGPAEVHLYYTIKHSFDRATKTWRIAQLPGPRFKRSVIRLNKGESVVIEGPDGV